MFTDQKERVRKVVSNALDGAVYDSFESENSGDHLLLKAHRSDGRQVFLRFRGVADSSAETSPDPGSSLRLRGVRSARPFSFINLLLFYLPRSVSTRVRVTIEAGDSHLAVVCEDAEWWEDEGVAESASQP